MEEQLTRGRGAGVGAGMAEHALAAAPAGYIERPDFALAGQRSPGKGILLASPDDLHDFVFYTAALEERNKAMSDRDRKKSWKEIDRMRDGSGRRDDRPPVGGKGKAQDNQKSYRAALDRAFESGKIADLVAVKAPSVAAAAGVPSKNTLKMLARIRDAAGRDDVTAAVDDLLKTGELPEDIEIIGRVLEHRDPSMQLDAMERIDKLLDTTKPKRARAMIGQLKMIRDLGDDPEMTDLASRLLDRL